MDDKRGQIREKLRIAARYQDSAGNVLCGTVLNISLGGLYIETRDPLTAGAPLNISLDAVDIGKIMDVHGRVVRVDTDRGMAVEFTSVGDEKMHELIRMIKRTTISSAHEQPEVEDTVLKNTQNLSNNTINQGDSVSRKEMRKHSRKLLRIEARYQDTNGAVLKGIVRDLSLGGVFIETGYPLEPSVYVTISLDAKDIGKVIDVQGKVVRVVAHKGMAIEFANKEHRDIKLLLHAMRRLDQASLLSLSRSAMGD
ncbi:MAG TPA: PilZ domain-containing protein [Deltaproteobacteria bacterium]|nr:PilZ domain-containing protein [Deltaproteobacteria bacterium]HPJ92717.1 PilZ domain-containing protein [Deltaproteobacteria bacterium]HPR50554.1 PilZ domain-containing protein [Deltaproteobacteria bacterium]